MGSSTLLSGIISGMLIAILYFLSIRRLTGKLPHQGKIYATAAALVGMLTRLGTIGLAFLILSKHFKEIFPVVAISFVATFSLVILFELLVFLKQNASNDKDPLNRSMRSIRPQ